MRAMSFEWYGRIFVIAIALMLSSSLAAYAKKKVQNKTFVVVGTSLIQGVNIQAAREAAISESLVTAVALMTEDIISAEKAGTLDGLMRQRIHRTPDTLAYRSYDAVAKRWQDIVWREVGEEVSRWHAALAGEKLLPGDRQGQDRAGLGRARRLPGGKGNEAAGDGRDGHEEVLLRWL